MWWYSSRGQRTMQEWALSLLPCGFRRSNGGKNLFLLSYLTDLRSLNLELEMWAGGPGKNGSYENKQTSRERRGGHLTGHFDGVGREQRLLATLQRGLLATV